MKKFSCLILTLIMVFSAVFCVPVGAASKKKPGQVKNITVKNYFYDELTESMSVKTKSGVFIQWAKMKSADYYRVYRKSAGQKSWKTLAKVESEEGYIDGNVKNNTVYTYTVKAFNKAGAGTPNTKGKTIKVVFTPEISSLENVSDGVVITWNKINNADKYYVYRDTNSGEKVKIKTITNGNTVSFKDTNVKSGVDYYYNIVAGNGKYISGEPLFGERIVWLSVPKLASVKSTKKGVNFTWKKVKAADSYIVYRKEGNGKWVKLKKVEGNNTVSYVDNTAKKGKTYTYTVKASIYGYYTSDYNKTGLSVKDKY